MLNYLAGGDRASPLAFWSGTLAVTIGVILHLPMFIMAGEMNYMLAGMDMDWEMSVGMVLIVLGTVAAGYGLLPRKPNGTVQDTVAPPLAAANAAPRTGGEADRLTTAHVGLLLALLLALVIDSMKPASLGFVVPGMAAEYGLARPTVAILVFFALTGTTIGSLVWGILADRLGRRAAILLAAVMFIGTSICGAMPSYLMNIVMCFLMGVSAGGMLPITFTLMAELVPARHRGWCLVLLGSVGLTAGYLAASGCAALLEPMFGWRIMWFVGLPTGLLLIALNHFIPESPNFLMAHGRVAEARAGMARFGMVLPSPGVSSNTGQIGDRRPRVVGPGLTGMTLSLNLAALAWGLVNFGLLLWLPADLRAKGYTVAGSDVLLARSALLALPTAAITAWLYTRWSTKRTLILLCGITAFGLLGLAALGRGFTLLDNNLVVLISLLMVGTNGVIAVLLPYTAESYPLRIRGRGTGFVAGSSKAGGIVVQVIAMAAMVPPLGIATIVLALPMAVSAVFVARHCIESRGRRLDAPS